MSDRWMQVEFITAAYKLPNQWVSYSWQKRRTFGTTWIRVSAAQSKLLKELYGK